RPLKREPVARARHLALVRRARDPSRLLASRVLRVAQSGLARRQPQRRRASHAREPRPLPRARVQPTRAARARRVRPRSRRGLPDRARGRSDGPRGGQAVPFRARRRRPGHARRRRARRGLRSRSRAAQRRQRVRRDGSRRVTFTKIYSGKVRDLYDAPAASLVLVASDRMSAFDVVMAEPVPDKGRVLTAMSAFWFDHLRSIAPSHLIALSSDGRPAEWGGRMMVVRRAEMLPIECIVRGYLAGSAWKQYQVDQTLHGARLPSGLRESEHLDAPLFTPSTKAASGTHDENISFDDAVALVGGEIA